MTFPINLPGPYLRRNPQISNLELLINAQDIVILHFNFLYDVSI